MRAACTLTLALVAACAHEDEGLFVVRLDVTRQRAIRGERSYKTYCAPCHGEQGAGDGRFLAFSLEPKPPDMGAHDFQAARSDQQLRRAIAEGSRAVGRSNLCPPWGRTLGAAEIEYLVHVIRSLERHPGIGLRHSGAGSAAKGDNG